MHAAGLQLTGPTSPAGPAPALSITARRPAWPGTHLPPNEELLARFGDAID